MRHLHLSNLSFAFLTLLAFHACKEEPPYINYNPLNLSFDSTYIDPTPAVPQKRAILFEDFTGVQCVNCPAAQQIIHKLDTIYQGQLNAVALHPNLTSLGLNVRPIPGKSRYDFRTNAAADICTQILGSLGSLPRGCVDRVRFSGQPEIYFSSTDFEAKVAERLNMAPLAPVNITLKAIETGLNPNEIGIDITIRYTQTQNDSNLLSIMLLQDSVIDAQEKQEGAQVYTIDDYVHMHLQRDMFTNHTGDLLNKDENTTLVQGRVFQKRYIITNDNALADKKHLSALAFVHKSGSNKEVLQSAKIYFK